MYFYGLCINSSLSGILFWNYKLEKNTVRGYMVRTLKLFSFKTSRHDMTSLVVSNFKKLKLSQDSVSIPDFVPERNAWQLTFFAIKTMISATRHSLRCLV